MKAKQALLISQSTKVQPPWQREGRWIMAACIGVAVLLAAAPIFRILQVALAPGGQWQLDNVVVTLGGRPAWLAISHTLVTGVISALCALVIGTGLALALAITNLRGKQVVSFLFVLSMLMAPQVVALAFLTLAGPASPLLGALGLAPPPGSPNLLLGPGGIMALLSLHHAPLAFIAVTAGLKTLPRSMVEAAMLDGASPGMVVRAIILPLLRPHLVAAGLLCFIAASGNFGIPAILGMRVGYQTLPTLIYLRLTSFGPEALPEAAALCLPMALIAVLAVHTGARAIKAAGATKLESEHALVPFWRLGRMQLPMQAAVWLLLGISLILPLSSLLASALVRAYGVALSLETLTFNNFAEILLRQPVTVRALRNSLLFSGLAALLLALFALPLAYALKRLAFKGRQFVEELVEIPFALPGIVVAIAMILLFLRPLPLIGSSLYATPAIILIAYAIRFLPLALKTPMAALASLDEAQEEAAAVFGASFAQRLRHVVFPALLPACAAGALLVFLTCFNELTVSALLWSAGNETLGVALFSLEEAGLAGEASALGLVATAVILAAMLALDRLRSYLPEGAIPWRL